MNAEKRMRMCQLVERMNEHKEYSEKLGLENKSSYRGILIENENENDGGGK